MTRRAIPLMLFPVLFVFTAFGGLHAAQPYYQGKMITINVGNPPGGGYDRISRLLAKHLPKHIPGKPVFIVQNVVGAGSLIACNQLYNMTKPDGLTIVAPQRAVPFAQLMKVEGARFDVTKFSWIGSVASEATLFAIRSDLPYKSFKDAMKAKEPIPVGGVGPSTSNYQFPMILKEFLGLNIKMVIYPSGTACLLAIEQKETDGVAASYSVLKPLIDRGLLRPLIRGRASEPGIENLPINEDLCPTKLGKTIMSMLAAADMIGRPYIAAPGTPREQMNILINAFIQVTRDPEMIEDCKKFGMNLNYLSGEECLKTIQYILSQPEDVVKEFSKYVQF